MERMYPGIVLSADMMPSPTALHSVFGFGLGCRVGVILEPVGGFQEMLVPCNTGTYVNLSSVLGTWKIPSEESAPSLSPPTPAFTAEKGAKTVSYLPVQEAVEYGHHKALGREHKPL